MLDSLGRGFEAWRRASLAPLDGALFRTLWIAALASNIGAVIQTVAASWIMTQMTTSAQMVALVQTASTLPIVILALPAGALADNMDRRLLMLASQIIGACAAAGLAALAWFDLVGPWTLLGFTALIGAAVALHQPAWQASLADFVPRNALPAAISLNVLAFNAARSIGPAIGGAILVSLGGSAAFLINSLSFLGLILVLATNRLPRAEPRLPPEPMGPAMMAGLRYVGLSPVLQRIFLRAALFALGASAVWSLMPLVALRQLGGGSLTYGLLVGALGAGSLAGAAVSTYLRTLLGNERIVAVSTLAFAAAALGIATSTTVFISIPAALVAGASWIFVFTTTRTCVQLSAPRWVVGRAVALGQVASFGCMSLGAVTWGAVAGWLGLVETLIASGAFMALSVVMTFFARLPANEFDDLTPSAPGPARPPSVAIDGRSGPVMVTIEYEVARDKQEDFLALMSELRCVRRRNGAVRWRIHQDIDRPEIWLERIESPTWNDHLRRMGRYTITDQTVLARASAYRSTASRPIRRMVERLPGSVPSR